MKKLRISAIIILILISPITFIWPVKSQGTNNFTIIKTYWGTDQPIEVTPGDVATLTVVLRNEAAFSVRNLKADLSLPNGFKAVGGGDKATTYYIGTLATGSIVNLGFPIFITPDVVNGNYTTDLQLEYYISALNKETLEATFEVTGKPSIDAKALNVNLREGRQLISITLTNKGSAVADNLKVTKVQMSGASVELVDSNLLGELEDGENITVPLQVYVPVGMKGNSLSLIVEASCLGPRSVPYFFSKTLLLSVKPSTLMPPLELNMEQELVIGRSSIVDLELKNTGSSVLSEIRLVLSPDTILKVFGSTTLYLDRLEPGKIEWINAEIYVPPTTTASTASLGVTVTYSDEGLDVVRTDDYKLSMLLRGLIEISLTDMAVIPSTPSAGTPFSITVTVTNVGTSTASAAYAIPILEGLPVKPFGPKSVYVGNIEINLPTTFALNLQLENTTQRRITLPVALSYMDNLRTVHNATFSVPIEIAPRTSTSPQTPQTGSEALGLLGWRLAIILGVSATVIVVSIVLVKRRRRQG